MIIMSKESPGFTSSSAGCLTSVGFTVLLSPPIFVTGLLSLVVAGELKIEQNDCHLKVTKMS